MSFKIVLFAFMGFSATMTACQSDSVRLRNPQTGEIAQCGPYGQMSSETAAATREQCIGEYQRQGYERVK
ncbi:MAG TPA: hypothetical protein VL261_16710 [Nitrospira sp.]|jgi:hypothetical protein|nr:hypothetical protein [Nitrospira sp.]